MTGSLGRKRRRIREDDAACVYCGGSPDTIDHVVPRSRGGRDGRMNAVAACFECNKQKGDKVVVGLPLDADGTCPMNGRSGFLAWLMWRRVKHGGIVPLKCPRTGEKFEMVIAPVGTRGV